MSIANIMSQPTAAGTAVASNANKMNKAVQFQWNKRTRQKQDPKPELNIEAQIDDVFLVLALLGEALLPLGVFDDAHYTSTLAEVHAALASSGIASITDMFNKLATELQYLVTAGLTICAVFAPMHVYRGFGACVYSDWDWGCPDVEYLEKKVKKETSMFSRTPDAQPNKPILLALDRAIQVLQVKSMNYLSSRPAISAYSESQPRYSVRLKKEVRDNLDWCEDWGKELERRGHPSVAGTKVTSWGVPWAGWTSSFSCKITKDWELILLNQMDPGRLMHAFLCRGTLTLDEGQLLTLPAGTPAEALACWLEGLPTMKHKIISWDSFDTTRFEKKVGKKMTAKLGQYPLPNKFVIQDLSALHTPIVSPGQSVMSLQHNATSPPPYSPLHPDSGHLTSSTQSSLISISSDDDQTVAGELGDRDVVELDAKHERPAVSPVVKSPAETQSSAAASSRKPVPIKSDSTTPFPTRAQTESSKTDDQVREGRSESAPPPLPPKIPNITSSSSLTRQNDASRPSQFTSSPVEELSAHYLRLLQSVARGQLSPQQIQEMFINGSIHSPSSTVVISEPQELDSDPAPPKFMGVSIPRGEIRRQSGPITKAQTFPNPWLDHNVTTLRKDHL